MKLFTFRRKYCIAIFYFSLYTSFVYAQLERQELEPTPHQADSLQQVLRNTNNDTQKMVIYKHLFFYAYNKKPDSIHYYNEQRLKLAKKLNQKIWEGEAYQGDVFTNLGTDTPKALKALNEAKRLAENEENEKGMYIEPESPFLTAHERRIALLAIIELQYALVHRGSSNYDKANENLFKAIHYIESINCKSHLPVYYVNLGFNYLDLHKSDSALLMFEKEVEYSKISGFKVFQGTTYSAMANIYKSRKDFVLAKKYLLESIKADQEIGRTVSVNGSYHGLSALFEEMHQPDSSLLYLRKCVAITRKLYGNKPSYYNYTYLKMSDAFLAKNQTDSAYKYLKLSTVLTDSFHNVEIDNLKKYQNFFIEEQKKFKDAEKKNIQLQNYGLLGGLGLFGFIGIILYRNNRRKQKANAILEEQKTKVESTLTELKSTQKLLIEKEKIATDAAARLQELDNVKTQLYTNITHEFRTPLTVILGVAEQMSVETRHALSLQMITRNGQNLLTLVNQMLDLSKLESGALALHYEQGDVVTFVKYLTESFHSLEENKSLVINFQSDVESFLMDFDETRLQQVVSNLLTNAIKFTPENGKIEVSINLVGFENLRGYCTLKIKDNGIGIGDSELPHIFDRFYQADTSATRHGEGTGIGLALTQELVKLMEGTIAVKSVLGEGTEFEVSLPIRSENQHGLTIHRVSNEKNVVIPSSLNDAISQTSDSSNLLGTPLRSAPNRLNNDEIPTILIADDNADVRIYISSILSSDYNLIFAKDGQECEELAFEHTPDLIILDVMMPFKDGFEVCKNLKTDDRTSHIPIIMLTAKADIDSKLEGLEQGADVYLMKPFNKEELLLRIKKLLELRHQLQKYYLSAINVGTGRDLSLNRTLHSNGDSKQTGSDVSPQNAFVQKLKSTIEKHLTDEDFDAVKLCREMTLSHSQLNRKLSALTGLAANAFIRYVRLIKAKELLLNSTYTINAIAYDCGFNDSSYFGRIFKQEFGETAQEWREKNIV